MKPRKCGPYWTAASTPTGKAAFTVKPEIGHCLISAWGFVNTRRKAAHQGVAGYQAHWERLEELSQLNTELLRRGEPLLR